jgi:hypothetical protein
MPNYLASPITQGIGGGTIASAGALGRVQGFQNPYNTQLSTSLLSGMRDTPGMGIHAGGQFLMNGQRTDNPLSNQSLREQAPAMNQAYSQYQAAGGAAQGYNPFVESANSTGSQAGTMGGQYVGGQLQGVAAKPKAFTGMSTQDWMSNPAMRMNQATGQQQVWQPNNSLGWQSAWGNNGMHDVRNRPQQGMGMDPSQYMQQNGLSSINSYNYQQPTQTPTNSFQSGMGGMGGDYKQRMGGMGPRGPQNRSMGQPNQGMGIMPTNTNQSLAQGLRTV